MLSKVINFLKTDIWRISLKNYSKRKSFFLKQLRVVVLAVRGFAEDKCKFRASALTFYSLLSIVPVLAMMFGIAKGFGLEKRIETELLQKMQGQEEIARKVIDCANSLLDSASGGFIAGIGVAFLFWTIIKVLSNIENSFNDIWGVKKPRAIGRKFSDYLSIMLVCPFLLIIASSATVLINTQIKTIIQEYAILNNAVGALILFSLRLSPYVTMWIVFTFIFIFMPNTKVKLKSGFLGGIVAGTIFQLTQWGYINFQIVTAKYSAIYGSFAALPLFLLWLQISWLIVLFGAELSFAHQNVETYEFEQDCLSASHSYKKLLALVITHKLTKNFCQPIDPLNAEQISHELEIPIRLVRQILFELVEAKIIAEVAKNGDNALYQPAVDTEKITIEYVVQALEQKGNANIPVKKTNELAKLSECLSLFASDIEKSPANMLLKDI